MTPGRLLIFAGVALVVLGLMWELGFRMGRLPGDIFISGRDRGFYFPITTCLLLSALASLVLWLLNRR